MRESKPHGFVAWLFDFYALAACFGTLGALLAFAGHRPVGEIKVLIVVLVSTLVVPAIYHLILAKRSTYLTPGEQIAGKWCLNSGKTWLNPYIKTRVPIFLILLFASALAGNTYDWVFDSTKTPPSTPFGRFWLLTPWILIWAQMKIGRGSANHLYVIAGYFTLFAISTFTIWLPLAWVFFGFALASAILGQLYGKWQVATVLQSGSEE